MEIAQQLRGRTESHARCEVPLQAVPSPCAKNGDGPLHYQVNKDLSETTKMSQKLPRSTVSAVRRHVQFETPLQFQNKSYLPM